jgi:hypothetical protein
MMMYGQKLAVAIKHNGKVLREFNKDTVYLPFGAEYSIFIKNLDTVRASVKLMIDGKDIGDGTTFVVHGGSSIELERFIKSGNFNQGNRFKFIERTAGVENHRGIGCEDGLIVVEYQFEKRAPKIDYVDHHVYHRYHDHYYWPKPDVWYYGNINSHSGCFGGADLHNLTSNSLGGDKYDGDSGEIQCSATSASLNAAPTREAKTFTTSTSPEGTKMKGMRSKGMAPQAINLAQTVGANAATIPINDAGITVAGSLSQQQFHQAAWFDTEAEKYSLVFKILGQADNGRQVQQAVTVKAKQRCSTCGHVNKANAKFCTECGTALELV